VRRVSYKALRLRDQCDDLCRQVVAKRRVCERCDTARAVDVAHLIPRRFNRTRCDLLNVTALCRSCHTDIDMHPEMKEAFAVDRLGVESWELLKLTAEFAAPLGEEFWVETRDRLRRSL